jgi:hypothetical protein
MAASRRFPHGLLGSEITLVGDSKATQQGNLVNRCADPHGQRFRLGLLKVKETLHKKSPLTLRSAGF